MRSDSSRWLPIAAAGGWAALTLAVASPALAQTETPATPSAPVATPTAGIPPESMAYPSQGDVIFSEIFVDPAGSGEQLEFVELRNVTASPFKLEGCILIEGAVDTTQTCPTLGGITGNCDEIEGLSSTIYVAAQGYTAIARTTSLAGCGVPADTDYVNDISYANTKAETVALYCPDSGGTQTRIADMTYDWAHVTGKTGGLTYQLDADDDLTDPTNPDHWCVTPASADTLFCTTADGANYGSPAAPNFSCHPDVSPTETQTPAAPTSPPIPWPTAGEVIFTELFIDPAGSGEKLEFVELKNLADQPRRLEGCYLLEEADDTTAPCNALGLVGNCGQVKGKDAVINVNSGDYMVFGQTADLAGVCGVANPWDYPNAISMANTKAQTMHLYCPDAVGGGFAEIFAITYDWKAAHGESGQTWMLDPDKADAPADPASWCPTEAIESNLFCTTADGANWGSPLADNPPCGEPVIVDPPDPSPMPITTRYAAPGEIIFTEILINPIGDEALEFVEIKSLADEEVRLEGCTLIEGGEGGSATCDDLGGIPGNCDTLEGLDGPLLMTPGQLAVLAQSAPKLSETLCSVDVAADYIGSMQFANTTPERVSLYCPDEQGGPRLIAHLDYDWDETDGAPGDTWSLDPAGEGDPNNPYNWCTATDAGADVFCTEAEGSNRGTPGAINPSCPPVTPPPTNQPPGNIQLVFTEIMIGPTPSTSSNVDNVKANEWFEWVNVGDEDVQLGGCYLEVDKIEARGTDDANPRTFSFAESTSPRTVASGERQLWARDGCLLSQKDDVGETVCIANSALGGPEALSYGSIEFSNSSAQYLALYCLDPDGSPQLIDEIEFDYAALGEPSGRSWQLQTDATDPASNDVASNWCLAPLAEEAQLYVVSNQGSNFGTPGLENSCEIVEVPTPDEGCNGCYCRLDTTGGEPAKDRAPAWALLLAFAGLGLVTRRPR